MDRKRSSSLEELEKAVNYTHTTYHFFLDLLSRKDAFANGERVCVGKFTFQESSQAHGMMVELGWAFFTRLEAALEAHVNRLSLAGKDVPKIVSESNELSSSEKEGYEIAREIRNILHHGDGDGALLKNKPKHVTSPDGQEPQMYPQDIDDFKALFLKVGRVLVPHAKDTA